MHRPPFLWITALSLFAACDASPPFAAPTVDRPAPVIQSLTDIGRATGTLVTDVQRHPLGGDVYHYGFTLRVGSTANAKLHIDRIARESAPWQPRPTPHAALLLHGDSATFISNFAPSLGSPPSSVPGLAVYLAQQGIDVWGVDRRWTQAPAEGADLSDFTSMGFAQELDDIGLALGFARALRVATGGGAARLSLSGFSRGGQLAYAYTAIEANRPAWQRHVKALVPLDVYGEIAPADAEQRQYLCFVADYLRDTVAAGELDSDNSSGILFGQLALTAPDDPSPYFPDQSNRAALLTVVGQSYGGFTPFYHFAAGVIDQGVVTGLRETSESAMARWFASGPPHQALRELADSTALWCGNGPLPVDAKIDRIAVPLLYIGVAGDVGEYGVYSTTRVASTDVTTLVLRRFGAGHEAEDFGHCDLLYGRDAPTLAWQPLASWLLRH